MIDFPFYYIVKEQQLEAISNKEGKKRNVRYKVLNVRSDENLPFEVVVSKTKLLFLIQARRTIEW